MATPLVSATAALMLSLDSNLNATLPRLTPDEVKDILVATAYDGKLDLLLITPEGHIPKAFQNLTESTAPYVLGGPIIIRANIRFFLTA